MTLNSFQKNLLFTIGVLMVLGAGFLGYRHVQAQIAARNLADAKARVERVMKLNICSHFSDAERVRLDKVSTDPEETRKVLLEIHKDRVVTWNQNLERALDRGERLVRLQKMSYFVSYKSEILDAVKDISNAQDEIQGFKAAVEAITKHNVSEPITKPAPNPSNNL